MRLKPIGWLCLNLFTAQAFAGIDLFHSVCPINASLEPPKFFYAKNPININSNGLLVARNRGGFEVGFDFNYFTPYDNQLDFAVVDPLLLTSEVGPIAPSTLSRIKAIQPHDNFGYGAEVGYAFPYSGTDLLFHYQTFSDHSSSSALAPAGGTIWDILSIYGLSIRSEGATSRSSFDLDQADLTLGNTIYVGRNFLLHPYLGAAYLKLDKTMQTNYLNAFSEIGFLENEEVFVGNAIVTSASSFRGIGPRLGLDTEYLFPHNFALVTRMNTSLYLGVVNSDVREVTTAAPEEFLAAARIHQGNNDRVIPALEAKLGLAYRFPQFRLKLEAGYQANHYFNTVNDYRAADFVLNRNYFKHVHDFNLYGPYLNISLYDFPHACECPCPPFHVGSIRQPGGFEFAIGFLRLNAELSQIDFGILDPNPILVDGISFTHPSDSSTVLLNQPSVDWGWQAEFAYHFACTAFDIRAAYQTWHETNSSDVDPKAGVIFDTLSMISDLENAPLVSTTAIAKTRLQYDNLDIDIGQLMGSSTNWRFRLFGGVRYTNLENRFETIYQNLRDALNRQGFTGNSYVLQDNTIDGIGPRIGAKLIFSFNENFSLIGEGGSAILVADKHSFYRDIEPANPLTEFVQTVFEQKESSEDEIMPNLDAKLALNFHTCYHTHMIGVELGYLVNHYFNATSRYKPSVAHAAGVKQVNDIDLRGYYVNLTVGGTPPNCRPVVEPFGSSEFVGGFEFAISALALQLTTPFLDFAVVDPNPAFSSDHPDGEFVPGPGSEVVKIQPHNKIGYLFHLGYAFPCSTYDVALNYFTYSNDKSSRAGAPEGGILWVLSSPARNLASSPWFAQTAISRLEFNLRNSNLEFAKNVKVDRLNLRFFTGGTYLHADQSRTILYENVTSRSFEPVGNSTLTEHNDYKGIGPRFGIDSLLELGGGLGLVSHVATDFYVGVVDSNHVEINSPGVSETVTSAFDTGLFSKKRNRIVTEMDLRIGATYVIPLCNSYFMLEVGYACDHYFNLVNAIRFTTEFDETFLKQEGDISLTGPYLKLQLTL